MNYLVTARKWRPLVFEDVIGQSHISTTLRNAISLNRLSHAYLFSGPRGVGKTTTARILAKAINCKSPKDFNPDNECEICNEVTEGRSMDVFEIDGASNRGIEEIRNLRESVKYVPTKNKYKVYVIDEVHMLTKEAFNALLKTLEEPPPHVIFIFATTEVHKVPATILSRCQRFDFKRIAIEEIMKHLRTIAHADNILIDDDALLIIAKKGDGSMRDAQSIFDQVVSFCGNEISTKKIIEALGLVDQELFFRTTDLIKNKDTKGGVELVEEILKQGYDIKEFLAGLNEHFRNLLIVLTTESAQMLEVSEVYKKRSIEDAKHFSESDILRLVKIVSDTETSIKWVQQPRFKLEVALIQMIKMDNSVEIGKLLNQIEELKKKIDSGIKVEGKVMASPPSFATAQKSVTIPPTRTSLMNLGGYGFGEKNFPSQTSSVAQSFSPSKSISIDEAVAKWGVIVNEAGQNRVFLKTILSSSRIIDCSNGSIKISCPNESHLEMLKKNREYITDLAQQIYGTKVRLEAIVDSKLSVNLADHFSNNTTTKENQHPIVEALKNQLGAVECNSNENY
ncbi:MAG: DNA polymerase III subunit gamma/tau [Bacteroidota bacterium]|nr:DNA polymerase III subunit gamma/tau [Bacteroidota bacterium]